MKKLTLVIALSIMANIHAAIEILDRVAIIVDDGVIMESQIDSGLANIILRYEEQNIPKPNQDDLKEQHWRESYSSNQVRIEFRCGIRCFQSHFRCMFLNIYPFLIPPFLQGYHGYLLELCNKRLLVHNVREDWKKFHFCTVAYPLFGLRRSRVRCPLLSLYRSRRPTYSKER